MGTAAKTGLDALKSASKKVVYKAAEGTGEFIGNKITYRIVKPDESSRDVEETVIPPEKREEVLSKLKLVL